MSFVVGNFPAQDAREFLNNCLQRAGEPGVVDADWEAVYKVGPDACLKCNGSHTATH